MRYYKSEISSFTKKYTNTEKKHRNPKKFLLVYYDKKTVCWPTLKQCTLKHNNEFVIDVLIGEFHNYVMATDML